MTSRLCGIIAMQTNVSSFFLLEGSLMIWWKKNKKSPDPASPYSLPTGQEGSCFTVYELLFYCYNYTDIVEILMI